jgi:phage head maturation protease
MIFRATWPATTVSPPGFWDRFQPRLMVPAPTVRPAVLRGIATVLDQIHVPVVRNLNGSGTWGERAVRILSTAFDRSLARAKAGRHAVDLRVDHDRSDRGLLASTKDGSLKLWREGTVMRFTVEPAMPAGRKAIRWVRANRQYRWMSVGCDSTIGLTDPSGTLIVVEAVLNEISLTYRPASTGTRVTVT